MRFLATVLAAVLAGGALLSTGAAGARADEAPASDRPEAVLVDAGDTPFAQPASDAEAREYEMREAASPEVQEFVGGDGSGVIVAILLIGFLVFLVLYFGPEIKKNA
jgi:hypothetical protein